MRRVSRGIFVLMDQTERFQSGTTHIHQDRAPLLPTQPYTTHPKPLVFNGGKGEVVHSSAVCHATSRRAWCTAAPRLLSTIRRESAGSRYVGGLLTTPPARQRKQTYRHSQYPRKPPWCLARAGCTVGSSRWSAGSLQDAGATCVGCLQTFEP